MLSWFFFLSYGYQWGCNIDSVPAQDQSQWNISKIYYEYNNWPDATQCINVTMLLWEWFHGGQKGPLDKRSFASKILNYFVTSFHCLCIVRLAIYGSTSYIYVSSREHSSIIIFFRKSDNISVEKENDFEFNAKAEYVGPSEVRWE